VVPRRPVRRGYFRKALEPVPVTRVLGQERIREPLYPHQPQRGQENALHRLPGALGIPALRRGVQIGVDAAPAHRGRGLGRALAAAARHLVPVDRPVWAQVNPGNAASVRAFLAAGYRPVGAEALLVP
ncbi:MAG: hypothetical protein FWJ87_14445, partial [Micromonosporaceae bacterium]